MGIGNCHYALGVLNDDALVKKSFASDFDHFEKKRFDWWCVKIISPYSGISEAN